MYVFDVLVWLQMKTQMELMDLKLYGQSYYHLEQMVSGF